MTDEDLSGMERRRRRVQRLKKMIITGLIIGVTVPPVLCVILFLIVGNIRGEMQRDRQSYQQELETMLKQIRQMENMITELTGQIFEINSQQENTPDSGETEEGEKMSEAENAESDTAAHKVYLTFDDGPSSNTNAILDILDAYEVKATFFIVGTSAEKDAEALNRIVEEGHTLGMHSYSHKYAEIYSGVDDFAADFQAIRSLLYDMTGVTSQLYRFPGGSSNAVSNMDIQDCISYLQDQDVVYFDWNVSSGDAQSKMLSADEIVKNCTTGIENKSSSVILLHDTASKKSTVEALPRVIEAILAMEDTKILPLTKESKPVQHIKPREEEQ